MKCREKQSNIEHGRVVSALACQEATIVKHPELQQDLQVPAETNSRKAWEVLKTHPRDYCT